jgi:hypothetical protein
MKTRALVISLAALAAARHALAAGAVEAVAREATQGLVQVPPSSVVVAAPLVADQPTAKGDDLALRIATLVAGRLGARARVHRQTAPLATARALARRASTLVYVQSEIARGDLHTTIDIYASTGNAWDRIRSPLPLASAHSFATGKIDAEVRSFLLPLLLEQASVHRARHDEGAVLALACGDVDGDGGNEVVLVSRARVAMGRVRAARFVPERIAAWSSLAPRHAVPMREPLASAVAGAGAVDVGYTDRGSLSLTPDFAGHTPLSGVPVWGGDGRVCLQAEPSAGAFDGAPFDCAVSREPRVKMAVPAPRFDTFAAASFADAQGKSHAVVAVREPSGKLKLRMDDLPAMALEGPFGAQLAVGDLDQDGEPEVATTGDGGEDAVSILTLSPGGELRPRLRLAAPAGVRALAVCPPEQGGAPVLVAVVGSELWLLRAPSSPATGTWPAPTPAAPRPGVDR